MKKFLSIFIAVAMVLSFASAFGGQAAPIAKAAGSGAIVNILQPVYKPQQGIVPSYFVGQTFYVDAVISNPTDSAMSGSAVLDPGATAVVLDEASKNINVPPHGTVDVWWKLQCTAAGDSTITVSFNGGSDSITVHQYNPSGEKLSVEIIEYPNHKITPSTDFVIKAKVENRTNPGGPTAVNIKDVQATINIDGPAELLNPAATQTDDMMYAGDTDTFAWNLHCTGPGKVTITVNATGINADTNEPLSNNEINLENASVTVDQGEVTTYGDLNLTLDAYKKVCTDCNGSIFYVKARVCNETGAKVTDANGQIQIVSGPASLQESAVKPFGDEVIYGNPSDGDTVAEDVYAKFLDINGDTNWEDGEPVYYDADDSGDVSANDTRFTSVDKYTAGVFPNYDGLDVSVSEAYGIDNNTTITIVTDENDNVTAITSSDPSLTITSSLPNNQGSLSGLGYIEASATGKHIYITVSSVSPDGIANSDVIGITKGTYAAGTTVQSGDSDVGISLDSDPLIKYDTTIGSASGGPIIYDLVDPNGNVYNDNGIENNTCKQISWKVKCTGPGPVEFKVTVTATGPAPQHKVFTVNKTITVDQKDVMTAFETDGDGAPTGNDADLVMPGDLLTGSSNPKQVYIDVNGNGAYDSGVDILLNAHVNDTAIPYGVYNKDQSDIYKGVGDSFDVTAIVKNCTCATFLNTVTRLEDSEGNPLPMDNIEFDPDNMTAHVVKYDLVDPSDPTKGFHIDPSMPDGYDVNITGDGSVELNLCSCCYYEVTWHLKCTAASVDELHVVTRDSQGNLLDSDAITVHQGGPPCISTGLQVFPGWYSDGTLETTERTTYSCGQKFTVVVPVTNIGGRTADNVHIPITATGDYSLGPNSDPLVNTIDSLEPGESYKIVIEATCTGDENVNFTIGDITGKDAVTHEDLTCIYKQPDTLKITQIPVCVTFKNPDQTLDGWDTYYYYYNDGTTTIDEAVPEIPVSTHYAVKVEITNNSDSNAEDHEDLKDVKVTLHWATWKWVEEEKKYDWVEGYGAELSDDTNPKIIGDSGIPAGESREVAWNMHCTNPGLIRFWVTIEPSETSNYDLHVNSWDQTESCCGNPGWKDIYQAPETTLSVNILSPVSNDVYMPVYATGQQFAVTATVKNEGYKQAKDVVVFITSSWDSHYRYAAKVVDDSNTSPQMVNVGILDPGESKTLTWTMQCNRPSESEYGDIIFVMAEGSNTNEGFNGVSVFQYPAAKLVVNLDPISDVAKGSDFEITGTIGNYGWADATNVVLTMNASSNLMPQPGYSFTLPIGTVPAARDNDEYQPIPFTFHVQCEDAGKTTITVTPSGADEYGFSWLWANRVVQDSSITKSDFIKFVQNVMFENGNNPYALKPIPDFCIVPVSTTFEQVLPEGPSLTVATDVYSPTQSRDITVTYSATGGTEPYTFAAKVDDGQWVSPIPTDSYTFHGLADGAHTLYIMVTDANGKYYIGFVDVVVDTTAPPAPSANPVGGVYNAEQTVTLSDAESGVSIYYTTDGTIPTTSSTLYTAPITIGEGITVLKAVAVDAAGNVSDVMTEIYNINIPSSQASVTLNLIDGWNLISVPFETSTSNLGTNVDQIYEWNGTVWAPVSTLEPGVGYLIHHSGSETITLSGAPTAAPFTIAVNGTWQLIGDPFEVAVPWSGIDGVSNISMAFYWDGTVWQPVNLATDSMQPGVGYLILTSNAGNLTFQRP